jgi:hypothetical protein
MLLVVPEFSIIVHLLHLEVIRIICVRACVYSCCGQASADHGLAESHPFFWLGGPGHGQDSRTNFWTFIGEHARYVCLPTHPSLAQPAVGADNQNPCQRLVSCRAKKKERGHDNLAGTRHESSSSRSPSFRREQKGGPSFEGRYTP